MSFILMVKNNQEKEMQASGNIQPLHLFFSNSSMYIYYIILYFNLFAQIWYLQTINLLHIVLPWDVVDQPSTEYRLKHLFWILHKSATKFQGVMQSIKNDWI